MRNRISKAMRKMAPLLMGAVLLVSCGGKPEAPAQAGKPVGDIKPTAKIELDTKNQVEKKLVSKEGGSIALKTEDGASIRIVFPQGSLERDSSLVAAPLANQPLKGSSIKGFSLEEKGTGKGPSMSGPAFVVVTADRELPKNTSIVRLEGDGYEVVPTTMRAEKGRTVLSATLPHFSAYTATEITPEQIAEADEARKNQEDVRDYDWVIYVKDSVTVNNGPMKSTVTVDLKARNMSGDIIGNYYGSATSTTTNDMMGGGGKITAPFVSKSTDMKLYVGPYLAPLTPPTVDPNLAPLETPDPEYSGSGSITMSSSGVGTVSAGGYSVSKGLSNDSTIPIEINIIGPQVRLMVKMPQATLYFDGYIRGEKKTEEPLAPLEPVKDEEFPLEPLEPLGMPAANDGGNGGNGGSQGFDPTSMVPEEYKNWVPQGVTIPKGINIPRGR
jgi:hypothetical protein